MQDQVMYICHKISHDDIANTMKENSISKEFLVERIKEILEESLIDERERQIERNIQEMSYMRSEIANLKGEIQNCQ